MRVSLIVCTRNRASRLPDFLAALGALEAPAGGWELIVVDNASSDGTRQVLESFVREAALPVQCVHAPEPGLSRARNAGLASARGDILAFTDDDCYPRPDYLRALVEVFDEGAYGFVGGRVVLHDPADARIGVKDMAAPIEIAPRSFLRAGIVHGANMAVTRDVVRAIGDFDPLLGAGTPCIAGEDIDYIARAAWAGFAGRYDPRPVVSHHHGRKPGPDEERQRRGYDYGRGAYCMKHVLAARSRRVYLSAWFYDARELFRRRGLAAVARELSGGMHYAMLRVRDAVGQRLGSRRDFTGVKTASTR